MVVPPSPACARCSKPIRQDTLVLYRDGELVHLWCRSRDLQLEAVEQVDRATRAQACAVRLLTQRWAPGRKYRVTTCPVCGMAATVTDWRPRLHWVAVEDCDCSGFFLWVPLLPRLLRMPAEARATLSERIGELRATGGEAW